MEMSTIPYANDFIARGSTFFTTEITFRTTAMRARARRPAIFELSVTCVIAISGLVKREKKRSHDLLSRIIVRYLSLFVTTAECIRATRMGGGKNAKSTETSKRFIKRLRGHWELKIFTLFIFSDILYICV